MTELQIKAIRALYFACKEFVRKCDVGEAKSTHSYEQMKEAMKLAEMCTVRPLFDE